MSGDELNAVIEEARLLKTAVENVPALLDTLKASVVVPDLLAALDAVARERDDLAERVKTLEADNVRLRAIVYRPKH